MRTLAAAAAVALVAVGVARAEPAGTRADAEAAELAGDWPAALAAWEACAAAPPASEARICAAAATRLRPQAADGFAGWAVLDRVRREYRAIGSDEATRRIQAALDADPTGPAAAELRVWLANEAARRGELAGSGGEAAIAADPAIPEPTRAWLAAAAADERAQARYRRLTLAGAAVAAPFVLLALRGPGPWRGRPALAAAVLLGVLPAGFAAGYEDGYATGFLATGAVASVAVLAAARAPAWASVPGTLGAFVAALGLLGWYPSLGW